jgi:predicted O-linked N-acetylglucosamine transferase (SPINDLY family)/GT2 family glycosyltransferase
MNNHIESNQLSFVIVAPGFNAKSGGVIAMYNLAKIIHENNIQCKIFDTCGHHLPNNIFDVYATSLDITNHTIVVYPEGINGNPLNAKFVVRWILCELGIHCASDIYKTWGRNDFVYHYSTYNPDKNVSDYNMLTPLYLNPKLQDQGKSRDGYCHVIRKGHKFHKPLQYIHPQNSFLLDDDLSQEDLIDILNTKKYLISYDPYSYINFMASLCGCVPIVAPFASTSKKQWLDSMSISKILEKYGEKELKGIAYGLDEIEYAQRTLAESRRQQEMWIEYGDHSVQHFINDMNSILGIESIRLTDFRNHKILTVADVFVSSVECEPLKSSKAIPLKKTSDAISEVDLLQYKPIFSIILPVFNTPINYLKAAINSVFEQTYPYWELCIADDASTDPHIKQLLEEYSYQDHRVKVIYRTQNGHISKTSNSAIEIATGEFIALLDHDDLLTSDALYEMALLLNQCPQADMIYSDEDKVDDNNQFLFPTYKPDWCPDSFLSRMYTCHLGVYRRSLINEIGGFRVGYEGSQDYDLVLRFTEKTQNIFHIPKILYHWRLHPGSTSASTTAKTYAYEAGFNALQNALDRRGEQGLIVSDAHIPGHYHAHYPINCFDLVSIIILVKDWSILLDQCLESIFSKTIYPQYEVILISNDDQVNPNKEIINKWSEQKPEQFKHYKHSLPYNYSKWNNYGVAKSTGKYLCFLNFDIKIEQENWLDLMIEQSQRKAIGAVGPFILDVNNAIRHAGVVLGLDGIASPIYKGLTKIDSYETLASIKLIKNVASVTSDCLVCRRDIFEKVGGFEEQLSTFNDVDLCLKILQEGYLNIYLPHIILIGQGDNMLPDRINQDKDHEFMTKRWNCLINRDPYCSPSVISIINSSNRSTELSVLSSKNSFSDASTEISAKLNLRDVNLAFFPDWEKSEDLVFQELSNALKAIILYHDILNISLLISNKGISDEDAALFMSSILMHLTLEESIDIEEEPCFSFVGSLNKDEWNLIAPNISGIINLVQGDVAALNLSGLNMTDLISIDSLSTIKFAKNNQEFECMANKSEPSLPLVSICIPTYNGEKFITEAIVSIFAQTYSNLEILFSDDNSSDRTVEIAKSFQSQSPHKFSILEHDQYGLAANWNFCISQAQGKYIKFLFQDDLLQPNAIAEMVSLAEQDQEIGLVFSPRKLITSNNYPHEAIFLANHEAKDIHKGWSNLQSIQSGQELLQDINILEHPINKIGEPSTILIRKEVFDVLGVFNPELCQLVDLEMWLRIMSQYKVGFVDRILSSFRIHDQQQTKINSASQETLLLDYQRFFHTIITNTLYPQATRQDALYKYEILTGNNLQLSRRQLAEQCLSLEDHQLVDWYQGLSGKVQRTLMQERSENSNLSPEDQQFANGLYTLIEQGFEQPQNTRTILAAMLYYRANEIPLPCDLSKIPDWLLADYLNYLFPKSVVFYQTGESESYYIYMCKWIDYLHDAIFSHPDHPYWHQVVDIFAQIVNFIPTNINDHNLRDLYVKRAEIIEFFLRINGHELEYEFQHFPLSKKKIKLGILVYQNTPSAETFATLPFYEYLSRDFEVFLYTIRKSEGSLAEYCRSCVNHAKLLPSDFAGQINSIREDDLDILFFGANVTAITNQMCLLASHRLARIQITSGASIATTGLKNMDYFISGTLTDPEQDAQSQYQEKLLQIPGTAHCFSYGNDEVVAQIEVDRSSLNIAPETVVFTSGANLFKIVPELFHTWAKIIAQVPNAVLMLLPYGPNWSKSYLKQPFEDNLIHIFAEYGLLADQLIILDPQPVPNRADVKAYYQIADIYLDSFPFAGTTSLIEPLQVGLPVIARQGNCFRSAMGAAMIQSLDIAELVATSEESYIQLAVNLGNSLELRQQKRIEVQTKMQNNPSFLDSRAYSAKIGELFIDLFDRYAKNAQNESLQLRDTNLMVFPDWNQSEESVGYELQQVIQTLATQPNAQNTTLLIDTTNIATEDAQMFLSSIAMNIMMEEDLDITEELGISLIEDLNNIQWENLLPRINSRIVMDCDDRATIDNLLPMQLMTSSLSDL